MNEKTGKKSADHAREMEVAAQKILGNKKMVALLDHYTKKLATTAFRALNYSPRIRALKKEMDAEMKKMGHSAHIEVMFKLVVDPVDKEIGAPEIPVRRPVSFK